MFTERRLYPRVNVNFSVEITFFDDEAVLLGQATNLSLSGMQIKINKAAANYITAKKAYPLVFLLSVDTTHLHFKNLHARLIVNRRTSEHHFQIGVKLCELSDTQFEQLKKFIDAIQA